jgi:DNA repair protein RadC
MVMESKTLELEIVLRDGLGFHEIKNYRVLCGDVKEEVLERQEDGHGTKLKVLLKAREVPTVIEYWTDISYNNEQREILYIYNGREWIKLPIF